MTEQLSLFGEENVAYNEGLQQLLELDFSGCVEALQRYERLFPAGRNVTLVIEEASFLNGRLGELALSRLDPAEAEGCYQVWMEFEERFGFPWKEGSIEEKLQARYFSRLADGLKAGGQLQITTLPGGVPMGLVYLLAQRPDEAIVSLETVIAQGPENGRAYGYLGDAYLLRGDLRTARVCYREAFIMKPYDVDVRRLQDRGIRDRLDELEEDEAFDGDPLEWFPVRGQLEGIFERRSFRDLETMKHWLYRYLDLLKVYKRRENKTLVPRLFYHAMVLSDNADMLQYVKRVDLVEIRRRMKAWQPALFARHMRLLEMAGH